MDAIETNTRTADLVDRYIAAWNEGDAGKRRDLVEQTFAPAASYVDPVAKANGAEGIAAMIGAVQARFPAHRFRAHGKPDRHNDRLRFQWALAEGSGEPLVIGTDIAVLAPDERMASVTGFFDLLPAQ